MKLSLFFLTTLPFIQGKEIYQVIYSGDEFHNSNGDAVIFVDQPDQAAGGSDLIVGCNDNGQCARTLLHFNTETLPTDAVITDVQIVLTVAKGLDVDVTLDMHQVTSDWSRTGVSTPDGERDSWQENLAGTAANQGDVTWKWAMYPDTPWDTEGGDVNSDAISSGVLVKDDRFLFFPMTEAFKTVVTGWIDGSIPNNGVLLKRDNENPNDNRLPIFFHELSGNKSFRSPKLLIVYTSVSQPEQQESQPSGPSIVLPGEPTRPPVTAPPTSAPSCPIAGSGDGTEVFTGTSVQHASIFLEKGDLSQDKGAFGVGIVHSGEILRGLLHFPVDSIPKGSTITCAEIILKTTGPCGPCKGLVDVEMHRITSPWTTTGTNDFLPQQQPLLYQVELQGAGANTGDVTWTHSTYNAADPSVGTRWEMEGGDVDPTVLSMELDNERGQHKFPTSEGFVDAIQGFVDGTYGNYGFLFKTEESAEYVTLKAEENTYKDYDTAYRLFHGEDSEEEVNRPLLVVHYLPPPPSVTADDSVSENAADATSAGICNVESSYYLKVFTAFLVTLFV